jgi:hypothetical protein
VGVRLEESSRYRGGAGRARATAPPTPPETGSDDPGKLARHTISHRNTLNSHNTRPIETATSSCLLYLVGGFRLSSQPCADASRRNMGCRSDHNARPAYAALLRSQRRENRVCSTSLNAALHSRPISHVSPVEQVCLPPIHRQSGHQ